MTSESGRDSFRIPARQHRREIEIKRSRFIATIDQAATRDEAKAVIARVRHDFPDARHHCWAYIAGAPDDMFNIDKSDDGEPRGTAGRPMLNVLQHSGLGHIVAVVTRYFGGIKLGAGGLVRAYGQAVNEALADLTTREYQISETITLALPYSLLDTFVHWLHTTDMQIVDKQFEERVTLLVNVPRSRVAAGISAIEQFGQGNITLVDPEP